VQHDVDVARLCDRAIDLAHECEELSPPTARLAVADDEAAPDVHRGKQHRSAVMLVTVTYVPALTLWLSGLLLGP
jgi:hypothetical protein